MKNVGIIIAGLLLASCDVATGPETLNVPPADETSRGDAGPNEVTRYPASLFHETTTFFLADDNGHGFSYDGDKVLASSDATGIFNALTLRADGSSTRAPRRNGLDRMTNSDYRASCYNLV